MNVTEKITHYKETFNTDPLYQKLQSKSLTEELFSPSEYFDSIEFDDSYSTKLAAEQLGLESKEQTIVNYINRMDFKDYLQVTRRSGRFYRYDWKALFRLKMIFLLTENGYTPMDVAALIGKVTDIVESDDSEAFKNSPYSKPFSKEEVLEAVKKNIAPSMVAKEEFLHYELAKEKLQELREKRRDLIVEKGYNQIHLNYTQQRIKDFQSKLKETEEYITTLKEINNKKRRKGLFSSLFNSGHDVKLDDRIQHAEDLLSTVNSEIDILTKENEALLSKAAEIDQSLERYLLEISNTTVPVKQLLEMNGEINDDKRDGET